MWWEAPHETFNGSKHPSRKRFKRMISKLLKNNLSHKQNVLFYGHPCNWTEKEFIIIIRSAIG